MGCEEACLSSTCACYEFHEEDKLCQLSLQKTVEKASAEKASVEKARAEPRKNSNSGTRVGNNHDSRRSSRSEYRAIADRLLAGKGRVEQTLRGGFAARYDAEAQRRPEVTSPRQERY